MTVFGPLLKSQNNKNNIGTKYPANYLEKPNIADNNSNQDEAK